MAIHVGCVVCEVSFWNAAAYNKQKVCSETFDT